MAILVSGGAGYIGSHTCVELLAAGYDIVVADNYYNSCPEALARGHVAAIKKLEEKPGLFICNLGTGHGYSVLDVIHAFSKACGKEIPYVIDPRRPGDIAECWCDPSKAKRELGWEAQYGIEEMCAHSWNWQSHNPDGYKTAK